MGDGRNRADDCVASCQLVNGRNWALGSRDKRCEVRADAFFPGQTPLAGVVRRRKARHFYSLGIVFRPRLGGPDPGRNKTLRAGIFETESVRRMVSQHITARRFAHAGLSQGTLWSELRLLQFRRYL